MLYFPPAESKYDKKLQAEDIWTSLNTVEMIDLMIKQDADYILDPKTRVMDNSCGTGNFLVRILERRIERGIDPITAVSTLYGMEIQEDNYLTTKARLKSYA